MILYNNIVKISKNRWIGYMLKVAFLLASSIVNFHGSVILPCRIKAKRCMSIMLWVTGRVWPYV